MMRLPAILSRSGGRKRFRGQGMVEFALILPVMLLVIFVIVELARLLHAYVAIENGARFGVRLAATGEFELSDCLDGPDPGAVACDAPAEIDAARLALIHRAAEAGSSSILRDLSIPALPKGTPGFFQVTVCSGRDADDDGTADFAVVEPDTSTFTPGDCWENDPPVPTVRVEDAGGPGDWVSVRVDFNHPLIVPILSTYWPRLHLTTQRRGIIEVFRVARVMGLPATMDVPDTATPSFTPSLSPTLTHTATDTPTPTPTSTPSQTFTPSLTFTSTATFTPSATRTPTQTPSVSATPDCSEIYVINTYILGDDLRMDVRNGNPNTVHLTDSTLTWTELDPGMYVNLMQWNFSVYYSGNDFSSPTSASASPPQPFPSGSTVTWSADFDGIPAGILTGSFTVALDFNGGLCGTGDSLSVATLTPSNTASNTPTRTPTPTPTITLTPSQTFTATITLTPSNTFTPSRTPTPSNTPTRTATRTPTNTNTATRTPTYTLTPSDTPTPTSTFTPSNTPTYTPTFTRTPTRTATPTVNTPTPTRTFTSTPTPTDLCDC